MCRQENSWLGHPQEPQLVRSWATVPALPVKCQACASQHESCSRDSASKTIHVWSTLGLSTAGDHLGISSKNSSATVISMSFKLVHTGEILATEVPGICVTPALQWSVKK